MYYPKYHQGLPHTVTRKGIGANMLKVNLKNYACYSDFVQLFCGCFAGPLVVPEIKVRPPHLRPVWCEWQPAGSAVVEGDSQRPQVCTAAYRVVCPGIVPVGGQGSLM